VQVGTISANGDQEIGDSIARAMEKVGKDGVITVSGADGIKLWRGATDSAAQLNDRPQKLVTLVKNLY
jgi:hypothetical protein